VVGVDTTVRKRLLERLGLKDLGSVRENLSPARLVEESIRRGEATLSDSGALVAMTGKRTGRSPADRFIVENSLTRDRVDWGAINKPFPSEDFERILEKAAEYIKGLDEVFVVDAYAGADPRYRLNVHIVTEWAWHALFVRQLFRRPSPEELDSFEPDWTVISVPGFETDSERDGTNSETFIGVDFERKVVLVCASGYAGEMKKSIFTVLNFVLPVEHGVLPMHCSANVGREEDDVALFFGLSGTGKTTISTDEKRCLIGDDEHGWSEDGVFNFEGGSYAKTIDLSQEKEPQIYSAIRFGAVLENVVIDEDTREEIYADASKTENTRVAYPLEYIENSVPDGRVLLPLRLHRQARRHGGRDECRGRGYVLRLLRSALLAVAANPLLFDAVGEDSAPLRTVLHGEHRLERRAVRRGRADRPSPHPRDGARGDRRQTRRRRDSPRPRIRA
jgi:phosphoenolpyruvate carboxykinase (ATP)